MKVNYYVIFFTLLVFNGCKFEQKSTCSKEEKSIKNIKLVDVKYTNSPFKISEFIEEISYISLSDEKLLGDIVQLYATNDLFFIRCRKDPSIYVFSSDGTYIKSLFKIGSGPGEAMCNSFFVCNEEQHILSFNWAGYIYSYDYSGTFIKKESTSLDDRHKNVIGYQDDILLYKLSDLLPVKGELCNPNGDYLLYGENKKDNSIVYKYENFGKTEKSEYHGVIAELETPDFITGKLDSCFWFKNLYMDSLYVFDKIRQNFYPKYTFLLGENPWDYKTYVHLYYLDKDYLSVIDNKTFLKELFLGKNHLIYKMKKGKDEGVGVYSLSENKNLSFTKIYINDIDVFLKKINFDTLLSCGFCDGLYLYVPVSALLFFEEGNSSFSSHLTEDSNPVILKMKLK